MNITNIIEKRDCGKLRICFSTNWEYPLKQLLSGFGLYPNEALLEEVSELQAQEIVETLLWKDLAYSGEIMPREDAKKYTTYFFASVVLAGGRFYTNALWHSYHGTSSFGFNPFTSSTFDGGVLIVEKNLAIAFWVENED